MTANLVTSGPAQRCGRTHRDSRSGAGATTRQARTYPPARIQVLKEVTGETEPPLQGPTARARASPAA